jgi:hypothetical protein
MLSGRERAHADRVVSRRFDSDNDGGDPRISQRIVQVCAQARGCMDGAGAGAPIIVEVADPPHLDLR